MYCNFIKSVFLRNVAYTYIGLSQWCCICTQWIELMWKSTHCCCSSLTLTNTWVIDSITLALVYTGCVIVTFTYILCFQLVYHTFIHFHTCMVFCDQNAFRSMARLCWTVSNNYSETAKNENLHKHPLNHYLAFKSRMPHLAIECQPSV